MPQIKRISSDELERELQHTTLDLAPRAIIRMSVSALESAWRTYPFDHEQDDLDTYRIAYCWLSSWNMVPVIAAFLHHDATPDDRINILLPRTLAASQVPAYVRKTLKSLELPQDVVEWCDGDQRFSQIAMQT